MDTADVPPRPTGPPSPPRRAHTGLLAGGLAVVLAVAIGVALAVHDDDGDGGQNWPAHRTYGFRAADTGTVVLDGVSGTVQITADPDARAVTGNYHRADGKPAALHGSTSGGALTLDCADDSGGPQSCAGTLVLVVPRHTGLRMRQTSGVAVLDGLGGDIRLDGSSLQLTTRDLRPSYADVTVVSGSADLGFAAAPADLAVHASSASVAVHLPHTADGYAVTTAAASADVQVQVPNDPSAAHRVALTVTSGSLAVQNT
ncbi:hypothetical protein [Actinacidiphila paucisporea]|uniref:Adhesin domain-containing protein n=1 Tax=Actinacidiphila paucisporea TaxID=310782 RepID=A0A1M7BUI7_9ACTN|nr:hypothetical protein [Actinacidiphila paucisporea]SHL58672.1 hypothetical protein SAMN05216499_10551 [Actinacidiphila paucisporea]